MHSNWRNKITQVTLVGWLTAFIACSDPSSDLQESKEKQPQETALVTDVKEFAHTNKLINETSPYLLQHAHNPVNWYPWGPEALQLSKDTGKPIFLSIGYSSCHWCHVMEHESFESEDVAAVLNEHFVSIKVDREERPDLDEIYMAAVQAMTGSGGWPMSVFLTPDLKPFFGGTYFPKEDKYGRPGFITLIKRIHETWSTQKDKLVESADQLVDHIEKSLAGSAGEPQQGTTTIIQNAAAQLGQRFDPRHGGFGDAPKFPSSPSIGLLLREYARTRNPETLHRATFTLDNMAQGGMYDHLGGGFSRYSTDEEWLVPHFEKMLYDNAQLVQVYLEAYQVTGNPYYRKVVEETLEYILRDMTDENGGFYSAEDADSEGEEGKFYVWSHSEIMDVLGPDAGSIFCTYYNVKEKGNFSSHETYHAGLNILHTPISDAQVASILKISEDELAASLKQSKTTMLEHRSKRVRPGLDDKILTSWNGMMLSGFAQAYQILGNQEYLDATVKCADFILNELVKDDELLRTHRKGESRLPAYLDDYAFLIVGLMDVYEATFDVRWIQAADELTETMITKFWDQEESIFYFTSEEHKNLIVRTKPTYDGATPSGNSMATLALLRLSKFVDDSSYYDKADALLDAHYTQMNQFSSAYLKMILALDFMLYPPKEIAVVGSISAPETQDLLKAARSNFIPNKILASYNPSGPDADVIQERIPLLKAKTLVKEKPGAYVCKNFACQQPVNEVDALLKQLELNIGDNQ
jgi:hypothetical protein